MHFPSLWLTILAALAPFVIGFVLGAIRGAIMSVRGGNERLLDFARMVSSDANNLLAMVLGAPLLLYALIGEFPLVYIGVAAALYVISGVFSFFITRAAGLNNETRLLHPTILQFVFSRRWEPMFGLAVLAIAMIVPIIVTVIGFMTAQSADLSTQDGRFGVAFVVFTGQSFAWFVMSIVLYIKDLWLLKTSRQARVTTFAHSMRTFIVGAWLAVFPFYQYRMELVSNHYNWVAAAAFFIIVAYIATVVLPFQIGRARFNQRRTNALMRLTDACDRVLVATDERVSPGFKAYTMEAVDRDLKELFLEQVRGCDFFRFLAAVPYMKAEAENSGTELAVLPTGETGQFDMLPTGSGAGSEAYREFLVEDVMKAGDRVTPLPQWLWIAEDHKQLLPRLDYRLFLLNRIEDFLENRADEGWLRGLAMQTKADAEKWLARPEGRSVLLASAGVVLSMLVPLAKDEFGAEARAAMRQLTRDAGAVVQPGAPQVPAAAKPAPKPPSP